MDNQSHPGEGPAIASLILGIIACLSVFVYLFSAQLYTGVIAVITGFVGIVMENAAKKQRLFRWFTDSRRGSILGRRRNRCRDLWQIIVHYAFLIDSKQKERRCRSFCLEEIYPLATHSSLKLPCH